MKQESLALWAAILVSWMIALAEYCLQVPANRIGSRVFSLTQLKVAQKCITLVVFLVYAFVVFREVPRWNTLMALGLIVGAVNLAFADRG